ncbi:hypothetical protein IW139_001110 [Coemansia sp. RSA 353]|nr:hypothetical protein GGH17_000665 [Coemansia sp. RSA 788]KAJ2148091.1 hypothetical protein IW142_001171 [Coemansia sp. RSA 564]KAJ2169310.1 hypothetical protein GGH15_000553 [Coemansia sp. RSA 562]KAJ2199276.1 hypothetical protein GGH18_000605 [Coemansia sp. RSA 530]KAJ2200550.1 hypothetical protein IW144_001020 [Coemansia sp. RSA 522]KAJ2208626.1 hypothetical protein IW145_000611 [Coemansia sp. RSA 521]KAJ2224695.1 hypothetical protein IW143_000429 [Coemansia sp. RSA 520]KAJ2230894.1 hyp
MIAPSEWRTLYRCLLRAAPRVVSGNKKQARIIAATIRQGFDESPKYGSTEHGPAALYRKGYNTLGFLKLARELGSVERQLVTSILQIQVERQASDIKPVTYRRKLKPQQERLQSEAYDKLDWAIFNIAHDLDIILPPYQTQRTLEWIPQLKHLYRNDANRNS